MKIEIPFVPDSYAVQSQTARSELAMHVSASAKTKISEAPTVIGAVSDIDSFGKPVNYQSLCQHLGQPFDGEKNDIYGLPIAIDEDRAYAQYELPDDLHQFEEPIRKIAAFEHGHFLFAKYAEVSLTVDQRPTPVGHAQREVGDGQDRVHRDGMPHEWRHIYMVSDNKPTEFYEGSSRAWLNSNLIGNRHLRHVALGVGQIIFANSTSLHRSPIFDRAEKRTFLRLTYRYDTQQLFTGSKA